MTDAGALNVEEMTVALRNIGFDLSCGACAEQLYTGHNAHDHDEGCFTNNEARTFAEAIDNVREALGQKVTHYLTIADDVKDLVEAIEADACDLREFHRKRSLGELVYPPYELRAHETLERLRRYK